VLLLLPGWVAFGVQLFLLGRWLVLVDVHVVVEGLGVLGESLLVLLLGVYDGLALLEAVVGLLDDLLLHFEGEVDSVEEFLISHVGVLLEVGPEVLDHVALDLGAELSVNLLR
jgi:hypothetical protein